MEKLQFLKSKTARSQKNNEMKLFRCTDEGLLYSLARNPTSDIPKVLRVNEDHVEFCKQFKALYEVWGRDHFVMFLKDIGEFLPMVHNKGVDYATPYLLMRIAQQMQSIDQKTRTKNVKAAMKEFPETKKMLREMKKNLDGLV